MVDGVDVEPEEEVDAGVVGRGEEDGAEEEVDAAGRVEEDGEEEAEEAEEAEEGVKGIAVLCRESREHPSLPPVRTSCGKGPPGANSVQIERLSNFPTFHGILGEK